MIDITPSEQEYYDKPEELLQESDLAETDIRVVGWNKKFRVRALSFEQMERINNNAMYKKDDETLGVKTGDLNHAEWVYWTIVEGITRPKFTYPQAKQLAEKSGTFVNELADEIWAIGRVSKRVFDAFIEEQKLLTEAEKKAADQQKK